ncbi:quinone oxidoreductase [Paroceanicella profunda]|uniref:Quinone oxidoreductase n=1 Tax=Paroceanicella profunda TaxID=2579971 RepID=A0A5B8FXQ5_9RHOB|nr:quinone oxidoreductase [Paroceanicella profunda]QDL92030.1 quinone oxidoreductase [Paroceanicella profunda]
MAKAIRISSFGGPEVLEYVDVEVGQPGPGEIRLSQRAVGLNYIDVYQRTGLYKLPLPAVIGLEGAGIVTAVGEGVTHLSEGDRVAYAAAAPGAYAEERVMPAAQVVALPPELSFEQGAAMMLQGLTVQYLFRSTASLAPGDTVLFHAAAGGVGLIACQWARAMGLRLIATAGTDEKCALAKAHGAAEAINYATSDFTAAVKELTDGRGVPVVMDSVGASTWEGSLNCLSPRGLMITFGNASGPVPPFSVSELAARGSLYVTRPTLFTYIAEPGSAQDRAADLFDMVLSGKVKIDIARIRPLAEAADAHRDLEARRTTGTTVFTL